MRLSAINTEPTALPGPTFLHDLVSRTSASGEPAIDSLSEDGARVTLSYSDFHAASDSLAVTLRRHLSSSPYTKHDRIIPVLLRQSPDLYITQLAILKAGAAFCPLNLDAPAERVRFILKDVGAQVLVTTKDLKSELPGDLVGVTIVVLDEPSPLNSNGVNGVSPTNHDSNAAVNIAAPIDSCNLAYVMYTSGSTGTPKGVGISHGAATQSLLAHDMHIPQFSRFLQFAAPTFDVSVFEIFFPFFRGATLVCCDREQMLDDLPGVIGKLEVDACELTPTVAGSLLRKRENAPGLKLLLTIGEMLSQPVIKEFGGSNDAPSMLWAMYGPTEATIHCTLVPAISADASPNDIGVPLGTVSCFVISTDYNPDDPSSFKLVDVGEVGELVVGGYQNAFGYLNRPEQTASVFIDSPFGKVYRTGDLAKLRADGNLECLGRMSDGQVKLRGQRIELGEVEHAVLRTPGCHGAVAEVINNILIVFCAMDPTGDRGSQREAITRKCSEWLPAFMVPGDIVVMDQFLRLPSGKVDRKAMKANYEKTAMINGGSAQADIDHALSSLVMGCISDTLGLEVGPSTQLASAGFDSLGAIRLASRIRKENIRVSAVEVLKAKTVNDLCLVLSEEQPVEVSLVSQSGPELDSVDAVIESSSLLREFQDSIISILPCTPLQSSMLFETIRNPTAYCNAIELSFSPHHALQHIVDTFNALVSTTDILRTGFLHYDGKFRQVVFRSLHKFQVTVIPKFDRSFQLSDESSFLFPLRLQILEGNEPRALLHIHHSVYDGWSMDMILADWATLLRGEEVDSRPQFFQVVSFYQTVSDQTLEESRRFWADHLLGWEKTPLPKLRGRVEQSDNATVSRSWDLSTSKDDVTAFSRRHGCSPQVPFQAALLWLWSSILGSEDVVIGSVTSGRTIPVADIERIIGPCIASLPLRANLSSVATIVDLINLIQTNNRAIIEHATLSLAEIRKLTTLTGSHSVYDLLFVYQESLVDASQRSADVVEVSHLDALETPILLEVEPRNDHFNCRVTYHSHIIDASLVDILLRQFDCIINSIVQQPATSLQSVRSTFPTELQAIYNPQVKQYQGSDDLAGVVETTAHGSPEKPAVYFARSLSDEIQAETLSFGELNSLANRIAWWTLETGQKRSHAITAIVMEKSALFYATILGVLKAGHAYLPILPSTPIARIQAIIEQSGASACLADNSSYPTLRDAGLGTVLDVEAADLEQFQDTNPRIATDLDYPAYAIYTSGTTGRPKCVVITNRNIVSHLDILEKTYPVGDDPRLLQSCSQAFDVSVFEIFFAWKTGMCVCSATNDVLFDDLERAIRVMEITHLSMTPTVASIVRRETVPRVRFLVTAGEPMTQAVYEQWNGVLYQGYGPSETTNICTVKKMAEGDHIEHLGFTLDNTSVFVFYPESLTPTPIGCVGEFCFGGDQVAQGYLNEPELTASKFIIHPTHGPVYRSGDLGRMLPDGSLLIIGRLDDQVKLRGQRIDVGEIASIITQTHLAASSVVLTVSRGKGSPKQLAAFYTKSGHMEAHSHAMDLGTEETETQSSLFGALESLLPSYMVPSYLIPISCIPMTPSGKIEKKLLTTVFNELSQEYLEQSSQSARSTQSESTTLSIEEVMVAEAISAALNVDINLIGRWTPLAAVGLDSITAISVAKGLSERMGKKAMISTILQNPSVAQLAAALFKESSHEVRVNGTHKEGYSISDKITSSLRARFNEAGLGVENILPCTPLQEAMLAAKDDGAYSNSMVLRLHATPGLIRSSWESMYKRHEILRTSFMSTDDPHQPFVQVVLESGNLPWKESLPGATTDNYLKHLMSSMSEPVDSMAPPFALGVVTENESTYLCFTCHHAMYDGVAISTLLSEVEEVAARKTLPPPVSAEPFLREALTLPESTDQFWTAQFRDFSPAKFSRSKDPGDAIASNTHTLRLDVSLDELDDRTHSLGLSLSSVSQAVWANVLAIATGTTDVCFGNVMNGRTVPVEDVERLVAPCFNTVPLRVDISEHAHGTGLLKYLHRLNPTVMKYQFTPLRKVQKLLSRPHGLFDTLLLLQPPKTALNPDVWELVSDVGGMDVPLVCELYPDPVTNAVLVNLTYDRSHFPRKFVVAVGDTVNHLMSFLVKFPSSALRQLHDLPKETQRDICSVQVNRSELAETSPDIDQTSGTWSDTETKIRTILSQLSSVSPHTIGKRTTIFQLGLDSINAVQVAGFLRKMGLGVSATDVLNHPTCEDLAKRLLPKPDSTRGDVSDAGAEFDISAFQERVEPLVRPGLPQPDKIDAILPCTPVQVAMLTQFVQSKGSDYFNYLHLDLEKGVVPKDVLRALDSVVSAHDMLRVGFVPLDNKDYGDMTYTMVKYRAGGCELPVSTKVLRGFSIQKWKLDMAQEVMASLHEPPWRATLVRDADRVSMHLVTHHALYDAHSLRLILNDLARCLNGVKTREVTPIQSALGSILSLVDQSDQGDAETFWSSYSGDAIVNGFPVMTPLRVEREEMLSSCHISKLTFDELLQGTRGANISIQAALQGAWTRVLSSYLGEDSVIFGTVMSGRVTEGLQNAVFPCITTVPVIARSTDSNRDLLKSMMEFNTGLYNYQFSRLNNIQRWLGHSGRRLFDTLLVYQRFSETDNVSLPWKVIEDEGIVDYPVSIEVEPQGSGEVRYRMTFRSDVLPSEQASILMEQLDAALRHLVLEPRESSDGLWETESRLAAAIPPPVAELPSEVTLLHQFVELEASRQPNKLAFEFVEAFNGEAAVSQNWTFSELNDMGNKVATTLSPRAAPGSIVAVHFDKCPEAYFSILGILKAGCSFLALDPAAPRARKEFILGDSKAVAVLVKDSQQIDFTSPAPVIEMRESSIAGVKATDMPDMSPQSTCYCLYTSGTTGTPKGCEITHENAVQAMLAFQELFKGHWGEDSRCLQFASLHFDVSVLEQYWSWSVGIRVVSAPRDLVLDDLEGTISRLGITHIDLTPSLAGLVRPEKVPSLWKGVFITGGEQLKQEILDVWGPKAVIYNAYGPTEATIGVTMRQRVPSNGRPANIGQQFPNVGTYVFRHGTEMLVPRGGVGELCVSGKLVGKGYLGREELTEERFPVLESSGERLYRTGDLVRLLHDGSFDFLGRADDQVKLRGQRLQLGEIDHAIRTGVPGVRDVATIVAKHGKTGKDLLVSFIVPSTMDPKTACALEMLASIEALGLSRASREACKERVPGYMVPTYVVPLPYIPLSANNKAEFKQLRAFFNNLSTQDLAKLSAPTTQNSNASTKMGKTVMKLIAEFIGEGTDAIKVDASIFELGLDSISIPRLARFLKKKGVPASPEVILKNPVIGDLLQALTEAPLRSTQSKITEARQLMRACGHRYRGLVCRELGVAHGEVEYIVPCTPIQQGMISRALAGQQEGSAYFNSFRILLKGGVSVMKLREAWRATIERHAILRTRFVATPEGFVQVALRRPEMKWKEVIPNSAASQQEKDRRDAWVERNSVHIVSPLEFIVTSDGEGIWLIIHVFHGLYDGNSFDTILGHVSNIYRGETVDTGPAFVDILPLGPLWRYDFCKEFWVEHLKGWRPTELPAKESDIHNHVVNGGQAKAFEESLDQPSDILIEHTLEIEGLEQARRSLGVTLQSVVLGLWMSTIQRYLSDCVTTGIIVSGRSIDAENLENCIGPLFNTLPFLFEPRQDETWKSLIKRCHEFAASVSSFQHVSLRDIQKWCSSGKALFDNLFAFQIEEPGCGDSLWSVEEEAPVADYSLAFEGTVRGGDLTMIILASRKVMSREQADKLLRTFCESARDFVENPEGQAVLGTVPTPALHPEIADTNKQNGVVRRAPLIETSGLSDDARLFLQEVSAISGLGTDEISGDHTLLNLGLDSIDTVKLAARLRSQGLSLTTTEIAKCADIGAMVALLGRCISTPAQTGDESGYERLKENLRGSIRDAGFEGDVEDVFPPTPLQETMVSQMLQTECRQYFNHDLLEVGADVDVEKLMDAWTDVWKRSPILRTVFVEVADPDMDFSMCQVVLRPSKLTIEKRTLGDLSDVQGLIEQKREETARAMGSDKLFCLDVVAIGDKRYVLLSIAHALYDGWSLSLLHNDVEEAYHGQLCDRPYAQTYLRKIYRTSAESAEFWNQYVLDARPTLVPESDKQETALHRAEAVSNVSAQTAASFGKKHGVSTQVLGQASWAAVLASLSASLDPSFGVVLSGRDFESAEEVMFPTMNTVAVWYLLHGTVARFLTYMEESMSGVREHQAYPLRKALKGRTLFNTLFLFQKAPFEEGGAGLMKSVESASAVEYPVCVELEVVGEELVWRTACQGSHFDAKGAEMLLYQLDRVLEYLVSSPEKEVLAFEHPRVSICGLPPVQLEEAQEKDEHAAVEEAEDEEWSGVGAAIRDVVARVSGVPAEEVRGSDTLYSVGLDSISAIKVAANLKKTGIHILVRELLAAESIGHMVTMASSEGEPTLMTPVKVNGAEVVNGDVRDVARYCSAAGVDMSANEVEDVLPALPMQVYMLSTWQNARGSVFHPTFHYQLRGDVSREGLQAAWSALVEEMPLLRTCFALGDNWPFFQVVLKGGSIVQRRGTIIWEDEKPGGHDLVRVRARAKEGGWLFGVSIHHALYDAVSMSSMLGRLTELCGGASPQEADISAWRNFTRTHRSVEAIDSRRKFWTEYLSGAMTHPGNTMWPSTERTSVFVKGALEASTVKAWCAKAGISLQALFFAAYAILLGRSSSSRSVVFGIYLANRSDAMVSDAYPTLNLVPLRVRLGGDLGDVARGVQRDIHAITEGTNASVGLWEVEAWTGVRVDSFVNFILSGEEAESEGVTLEEIEGEEDEGAGPVPGWMAANKARRCFPAAVDVEASVTKDGLNIGVFAPRFMMGEEGASETVKGIKGILSGLTR